MDVLLRRPLCSQSKRAGRADGFLQWKGFALQWKGALLSPSQPLRGNPEPVWLPYRGSEILLLSCLTCIPLLPNCSLLSPPPPPFPGRVWGSPGIKALLAMVVGEWQLPAAGQGRLCAGTLGLLLDPGGGAVESYCRRGRRQSEARVGHRGGKGSS